MSDAAKPGDRSLMFTVGDGNLIASTYAFSMTGKGNDNMQQTVPYEDDLESWFWVYFGYNYETSKAYAFVRFYDRVIHL